MPTPQAGAPPRGVDGPRLVGARQARSGAARHFAGCGHGRLCGLYLRRRQSEVAQRQRAAAHQRQLCARCCPPACRSAVPAAHAARRLLRALRSVSQAAARHRLPPACTWDSAAAAQPAARRWRAAPTRQLCLSSSIPRTPLPPSARPRRRLPRPSAPGWRRCPRPARGLRCVRARLLRPSPLSCARCPCLLASSPRLRPHSSSPPHTLHPLHHARKALRARWPSGSPCGKRRAALRHPAIRRPLSARSSAARPRRRVAPPSLLA
jgi:hypothetical protein